MELTAEETVTKLLSSSQILNIKDKKNVFLTDSMFDLGEYLRNFKPEPSPYEGKYVFIK